LNRVQRRTGYLVSVVAAALMMLALPASSSAAVTCNFTGTTVDIDITAGGAQFPQVSTSGSNIVVTDAGTPLSCGTTPTLTTVDTITIDEVDPNLNSQVNISVPDSGFGPGATAEPTGTSEIEFDIELGGETVQDSIGITGLEGVDHIRAGVLSPGVNGVNLNPPEAGGPDGDDVRMTGIESFNPSIAWSFETDQNIVDATGGPEFTGPLVSPTGVMNFSGGGGPDRLAGGDQANFIGAGEGDDLVISGRGLDNADGEDGVDTISYVRATSAVTMTINQAGADTGGGGFDDLATFENIVGSPFGDNLTGDGGANDVVPGDGADNAFLLGANDTFNSLDETADTIDCGDGGADSGIADPVGVDTVTNCESVNRPPETTGVNGPSLTNDPTPLYGLTANEPSTFEFRADGGGFSPCAADCEVSSLTDGTHQLAFRATDATPLVEQTPEPREVTVDTAAPETQIDSGPADGATLDGDAATFGFSSEAGASFECALDAGAFEDCASPIALDGLGSGSHDFRVRAVDAAGNVDGTPAARTFTVPQSVVEDREAPDSLITKVKVKGDNAKVRFTANERGSRFSCRLDRKKFKPCTSPKRYRNLDDGRHRVFVLATDAAGNQEPKAAKAKFKIED
jgi:hypothetical protein